MIALELADLVLIASRALGVSTETALDLLDIPAARAALAAVPAQQDRDDPALPAAVLLHALVTHRPFRRGNRRVALVATLQVLALAGWRAELDPPEETEATLAAVAAGGLAPAALAAWLAPRLRPDTDSKEAPMRRWLPGRKRPRKPGGLFTRFSDPARQAVKLAQEEARLLNHNYIGTEHILLGLIHEGEGMAAKALESLGVTLETVRSQVEEIIGLGATAPPSGHIPFTPRAKKVLELSLREALRLGDSFIGTEHILLGLVREGEGVAAQALVRLGADLPALRERVLGLRAERPPAPAEDEADAETLREQNRELRREVKRLRDLLRQHGIEPDGGASQSA